MDGARSAIGIQAKTERSEYSTNFLHNSQTQMHNKLLCICVCELCRKFNPCTVCCGPLSSCAQHVQ